MPPHARAAFVLICVIGCRPSPTVPPSAPAARLPVNASFVNNTWQPSLAQAVDVAFDGVDGSYEVWIKFDVDAAVVCKRTPCMLRLIPGVYDVVLVRDGIRGDSTLQIPRAPTIVNLACNAGAAGLGCTPTITQPPDGIVTTRSTS
jgi:hypothetical protein